MSKLYDDVKKQGEQIDDLQKTVTNHSTRIETLETKAKATPPTQAVNQRPITVKLPDNIATNESIGKLLDEKLLATSTDGTLKKVMEQLPGSLSKGVADTALSFKISSHSRQMCYFIARAVRVERL